ncbi:MAG: phosphoglucosamine mutase [Pyrinomonadaceae bacterium]
MKKLFGTDGIRSEAGIFPLDEATVEKIGRSLGRQFTDKLGRPPRVVTGRDTRESGSWIEEAFHAGAKAQKAECESAGVITTPGVAFVTSKFGFDLGIVISASHNPYHDNGIKIFSPSGKKVGDEIETVIETDIFSESFAGNEATSGTVNSKRKDEFREAYLAQIAEEMQGLRLDGFSIAVDCANGAASDLAPDLFRRFGADVIAFNDKPDSRNINKDCGSLHLEHLQAKVLETKADFGVAFDGDADRALFVDEKGRIVDGDATLWIMAKHFQEHGGLKNNKVVATVMSNIGLEIALRSRNIELVRTSVGDKNVLAELLKSGSTIGGEQSGHVIFPYKSLVGDGMMTATYLLEAIKEKGFAFSAMTEGFRQFPQILVNVKVKEKLPFESVPEIAAASREMEAELDGKGRLLLRYSGTENLARVMIEGEDQAVIESQANRLADVIRSRLG